MLVSHSKRSGSLRRAEIPITSVGWRSSFAFREEAAKVKSALVGTTQLVLVEGVSTAAAARLTITCRPDGHKGVYGRHCVMTLDGG